MNSFISHPCRRAFTLLEMLITITVIASLAVLVTPLLQNDARLRVMAASTIMVSDIELAQTMTISEPQDPLAVVFDDANNTYWLAYADDSGTPITREQTGTPYVVELGLGRAAAAAGVTFTSTNLIGDIMTFDAQGGLEGPIDDPEIDLTLDDTTIRLTISAGTGLISETEPPP